MPGLTMNRKVMPDGMPGEWTANVEYGTRITILDSSVRLYDVRDIVAHGMNQHELWTVTGRAIIKGVPCGDLHKDGFHFSFKIAIGNDEEGFELHVQYAMITSSSPHRRRGGDEYVVDFMGQSSSGWKGIGIYTMGTEKDREMIAREAE